MQLHAAARYEFGAPRSSVRLHAGKERDLKSARSVGQTNDRLFDYRWSRPNFTRDGVLSILQRDMGLESCALLSYILRATAHRFWAGPSLDILAVLGSKDDPFGFGKVYTPDAAVVAAMDRDGGRWSYQRVRWDMDVLEQRTKELLELRQAVSHGDLPDRDHDGTTWHCSPRSCRWSSLCWEGSRPFPGPEDLGEGLLDIEDPAELGKLTAFAEAWRVSKELETSGKAMQNEVRDAYRNTLSLHGAKKLAVGGLLATLVSSSRRSWDEKKLREFLTEEQLRDAQRVIETTSLSELPTPTAAESVRSGRTCPTNGGLAIAGPPFIPYEKDEEDQWNEAV